MWVSIFIDGMRVSEEEEARRTARRRDEAELRRIASRVSVELQRAELLSRTAAAGESLPTEVRRAVREACVLRVRRLRSFFYGDAEHDEAEDRDGPLASAFFDEPERWERERPPAGPMLAFWLDEVKVGTDSVLDGRERAGLSEEKWPLVGFVTALVEVFDAFVDALPPERAAWFAARSVHSVA